MASGNWSVFGFRLPELGITEKFGGKTGSTQPTKSGYAGPSRTGPQSTLGSQSTYSAPTYSSSYSSGGSTYTPPSGGSNDTDGGGTGFSASDFARSLGYASTGEAKAALGVDSLEDYYNSGGAQAGQISDAWDDYLGGLDNQIGNLQNILSSSQDTATSQYNQGLNTLGNQLTQGQQFLEGNREEAQSNQARNLRDISGNIRNAFQAGNVYLGTRGAADSSAANQYSYALTKMGTQQRSDVMQGTAKILNDINQRESMLKSEYDTAVNNLEQQKNERFAEIDQWFNNAMIQIQNAKNEGRFRKAEDLRNASQDALNRAIQEMNRVQSEAQNRRSMLEQWALGVSSDINSLRANWQEISRPQYGLPQASSPNYAPNVDSSGNINYYSGAGGYEDDLQNNIFSNIRR